MATPPVDEGRLLASPPRRQLAAKIGAIGCVILLLALSSIGVTLWVTWQLEGGAAAVNEAGRMRMRTWELAAALAASDHASVHALLDQYDASLQLLHEGDPARPLAVPRDDASREALAEVGRQWRGLRQEWGSGAAPAAEHIARQAGDAVRTIDRLVLTIEQQLARWTTLLNSAQFVVMVLAITAALGVLYAAQLLIFSPLARLREGLGRVESGDLSARVAVLSDDEFGAVATGFNRMSARLQDLYASLERRVREKTLHLEAERARLAVLYEGAALAARAGTLEALAQGFASHTRRALHADASVVRWADEHTRRYMMLASEGLPAQLTQDEYCLPAGDCFCGQPRERAQTRMFALNELRVGVSPAGLNAKQCQRAGYASVLSAPVKLQDRVVGEIDLFFLAPTVLGKEDRVLLDTLASHLAGAMEGLRADALRREAAVAEERGLLARELHDSIAQSLSFLKIQASLLREEVKRAPGGATTGVQGTLAELDAGIKESLSDVRELLLHFRTRTNNEDIAPALRTTLTKFEHQTGLQTELDMLGEGMALPPDIQIQVLHVIQEALSNVRKHARASRVWVTVRQSPQWVITVRDDGCGMDATRGVNETHVGLRIMRERAAGIGASLDISAAPGQGTCVTLVLPVSLPASAGKPAGGT